MAVPRTPDGRFAALPDDPFGLRYDTRANGLRVHYLDKGPLEGPVVLMMHGQSSWSVSIAA